MATEDRPERAATEWQILGAVERVLERVPFHELSVGRICAEAGVTRPTFYHYFPSKFAVINELLAEIVDQLVASTRPFLDRGPDVSPPVALRASFDAATDVWVRHRYVLRAVSEHWNQEPELRRAWSRLWNRVIAITAEFIDRERETGNAPPGADSRLLAATMLWGAERVLYVAGLETNDELPDEKALVEGLVAVWHGVIYGPPPPADPPAGAGAGPVGR